jgi:hypothetical protein
MGKKRKSEKQDAAPALSTKKVSLSTVPSLYSEDIGTNGVKGTSKASVNPSSFKLKLTKDELSRRMMRQVSNID